MILDNPVECPRCGAMVKLVDEVRVGGRVVTWLCTVCAEKPADAQIDKALVQFRRLVRGIIQATERNCTRCSGQGWSFLGGGRGLRLQRCPDCVGTGVDMNELLRVLEIEERPRPVRHAPPDGCSPGRVNR